MFYYLEENSNKDTINCAESYSECTVEAAGKL